MTSIREVFRHDAIRATHAQKPKAQVGVKATNDIGEVGGRTAAQNKLVATAKAIPTSRWSR